MIRELSVEELPLAAPLGYAARLEGLLPSWDRDAWEFSWKKVYEMGAGKVWGLFSGSGECIGAVGAVVEADLYSGETIGREAFWYVEPESRGYGLRLLPVFEGWCREKGCTRMYLTHHLTTQAPILNRVYGRRGYTPVDLVYVREVN